MKLKRRDFLKLLALITGAGVLGRGRPPRRTRAQANEYDVLIVGAGASGIAAGRALADNGYKVLILEARTRLGGRVWTDTSLGVPLDLGASWIHGVEGNPLSELVARFGIQTVPFDYENRVAYDAQGARIADEVIEAGEERLDSLLETAADEAEGLDEDVSLGEMVESAAEEEDLDAAARRLLAHNLNTSIEHEYAADVSSLSAWYWDEGEAFEGDDVLFPDGYSEVLTRLADGLEIRYGQPVTYIEYGAMGVRLTTALETFESTWCILTVPLGVLKNASINFNPPLPAAWREAVSALGMGVLDKAYLLFDEVFWDVDASLLNYVGEEVGHWAEWVNMVNISKLNGQPILLGFNAGAYARQLESLTDAEIVADAMQALRTMYGADVPDPKAYKLTRWARDNYAYGSYSYLAVGATPDHRAQLGQNLDMTLFIAGEATSVDYPSTVHGALLRGLECAEMIMDGEM